MSPVVGRIAVVAAVLFAIAAPALQAALDLGLSASEFADRGDETLRAAGYAFSIWSLIYLGLIAYAIWQVLPRNRERPLMDGLAWPAAVAIAGTGLWICASAADARWATVAIIAISAISLVGGLLAAGRHDRGGVADWLLVWWPLGLLAGWLTIATALNILTVLTAEGLITPSSAPFAAVGAIVPVVVIALAVLGATRLVAYGVPIAWGLVAVWVAEKADKPAIATAALAAAVVIALFAAWLARPTSAAPR